jgi:sugar lactone lactonase YvrE
MSKLSILVGILGASLLQVTAATAQVINTIAGRGAYTTAPAASVPIPHPWPLALSTTSGSIYFGASAVVYRYDPTTGTFTRVAGNGTFGYAGDNGPATSARLSQPAGLALDGAGNLYIADLHNNVVRKVSTTGTITTFAGNGKAGYSGDLGPATNASLNAPYYLAIHGNSLYIADSNNAVRVVTGGTINTVAGTAGSYPLAVQVDSRGDLYYIDDSFSTPAGAVDVLEEIPLGGVKTMVATLNDTGCEEGLAIDPAGHLYTTDSCLQNVYEIVPGAATPVSIIAGTSAPGFSPDGTLATAALLGEPSDVALDGKGLVVFTDWTNDRLRKFAVGGTLATIVGDGNGDGAAATQAPLNNLKFGLAPGAGGKVQLTDVAQFRQISPGGLVTTVAGSSVQGFGGDGGPFAEAIFGASPGGVDFDAAGDEFIADSANHRIRKVDHATGRIATIAGTGVPGNTGDGGSALSATLFYPHTVAVDSRGNVYLGGVCPNGNYYGCPILREDISTIRKIDSAGVISTVAGNGLSGYNGDGIAASSAELNHPLGFTADRSGNLYIADTLNHRVRRVDATSGIITTVAGTGTAGYDGDNGAATDAELNFPRDVAIDAFDTLYIADTFNDRIRRVTASGIISTVAGTGKSGFSGDGGEASLAELSGPWRLALDSTGSTLYLADTNNNRLRLVQGLLGPTTLTTNPTSLAYANQAAGTTSAAKLITLKNTGARPLNVYSVTLTGSDPGAFSFVNACDVPVVAGRTCTIGVKFRPPSVGAQSAEIRIASNATTSPGVVNLSGSGVADAPAILVTPAQLTFGAQARGTASAPQTITVKNTGSAALKLSGATLTGKDTTAFKIASDTCKTLAVGGTCTISVSSDPPTAGVLSASLSIASNAASSSAPAQRGSVCCKGLSIVGD